MQKRGFTLIELLVVISIIGILSGIIITGLGQARVSSRDARRVSDIKNIQLALQLYYADNAHYPCSPLESGGGTCPPDFTPTYMGVVPKDPSGSYYFYTAYNSDNSGSTNCSLHTPTTYHLGANMEGVDTSYVTGDDDRDNSSLMSLPYKRCSATGADFNGKAAACSGTTAASTDDCYDVLPN